MKILLLVYKESVKATIQKNARGHTKNLYYVRLTEKINIKIIIESNLQAVGNVFKYK